MTISQREARRLRKRVATLEYAEDQRRRTWSQEWFGGVEVARFTFMDSGPVPVAVRTARKLGHAVVVVGNDSAELRFHALPLPKVRE